MLWSELKAQQDYRLKRTVAPVGELMDLCEFKQQCRIDTDEEDQLLTAYLAAATETLETDTQRAFLSQTWQLSLDEFPSDVMELRVCPAQSATVAYLDGSGVSQTLSTDVYFVDTANEPGRITLKNGQTWPTTYDRSGAVTVTFVAGYPTPNAVPQRARQAIRMLAAHWFNARETVADKGMSIPYGYDALVDRLRWAGYR